MFNFDRSHCERMVEQIFHRLEDAEEDWRTNNIEWKRKVERWEDWKSREKDRARAREKLKKGDLEDIQRTDGSWESTFDPNDPSPQFSFSRQAAYPKQDLQEDIRLLERRSLVPQWVCKALWRGIGVHHSGMNKNYRSLVERYALATSSFHGCR